jgi:hypothetical protein
MAPSKAKDDANAIPEATGLNALKSDVIADASAQPNIPPVTSSSDDKPLFDVDAPIGASSPLSWLSDVEDVVSLSVDDSATTSDAINNISEDPATSSFIRSVDSEGEAPVVNEHELEDEIDMSKIDIVEEKEVDRSSGLDLSSGGKYAADSPNKDWWKFAHIMHIIAEKLHGSSLGYYVIALVVIFIGILGSFVFYYMERYLYHSTQFNADETANAQIIPKTEKYLDTLEVFGLISNNSAQYELTTFGWEVDKGLLADAIAAQNLSYIQKYEVIERYIDVLTGSAPTISQNLTQAKEELASYPYFPSLLQDLIDVHNESSLQRSVLSLEAVKFRTALAVFKNFETFLRQFSTLSNLDKTLVSEFMETALARGDVDIDYYLSTCYLNPYELSSQCLTINDFARMYEYYRPWDDFSPSLFAAMMAYIESKLESSLLPSLSLISRDFNPVTQQITLVVDVNTFPDDQLQLFQQWILNPHVYVISQMINFLRQSKFVISENINISELDIEKDVFYVGTKEVIVSTTHMEFILPLQKNTQREITDFLVKSEDGESFFWSLNEQGTTPTDEFVIGTGDSVINPDAIDIATGATIDDTLPFSGGVTPDDQPVIGDTLDGGIDAIVEAADSSPLDVLDQ